MKNILNWAKKSWIGILIGVIITIFSIYFTKNIFKYPGSVTLAILIGIIIGNIFEKRTKSGAKFLEKKILPLAIIFLGSQLNFEVFKELGFKAILFLIIYMLFAILLNIVLSYVFKFSRKMGLLLGIGNAVCGSSAIAAASEVLKPKEEEVGISVAIVNLAGVIGIFLMPTLAKLLNFDIFRTSALIGGTIQAVSQTAAAGFSVSKDVGSLAIVFKMIRVSMLGPIIILLTIFTNIYKKTNSKKEIKNENKNWIKIFFKFVPPFIIGFITVAILCNIKLFPKNTISSLKTIGKVLLTLSMAGMGMNINFKSLISKGIKVILAQFVLIIIQTSIAILLIYIFIPN